MSHRDDGLPGLDEGRCFEDGWMTGWLMRCGDEQRQKLADATGSMCWGGWHARPAILRCLAASEPAVVVVSTGTKILAKRLALKAHKDCNTEMTLLRSTGGYGSSSK
jgi:hypothetical protein